MSQPLLSRYVATASYRTHYSEAGNSDRVILGLHGGGAGSSGYAGIGLLAKHLADDFRIIGPDSVGGFGLTDVDAPAPQGTHSRVDQLELFTDALCLDRFTLMGNSQGAWAAARYAILHPERVERLVLIASASIGKAMGIPQPNTPGLRALRGFDGTRDGMRRLMEALVANKDAISNELVEERYRSCSRPGAKEALSAFVKNTQAFESDPRMQTKFDMRWSLPTISKAIPTTFIWGEEDSFAPAEIGRRLETMLPDVKFHFVPNAGHQAQTDRPEIVAELTHNFIRQTS